MTKPSLVDQRLW